MAKNKSKSLTTRTVFDINEEFMESFTKLNPANEGLEAYVINVEDAAQYNISLRSEKLWTVLSTSNQAFKGIDLFTQKVMLHK